MKIYLLKFTFYITMALITLDLKLIQILLDARAHCFIILSDDFVLIAIYLYKIFGAS